MPQIDPINDLIGIYDKDTGIHSETTPASILRRILVQGADIALAYNVDGTITVSSAIGGLGGAASLATVAHDASLTGDGTTLLPLAVAQALENRRGGGQIITQAEANASRSLPLTANDVDILTIAKLLNLGGDGLADLKALLGINDVEMRRYHHNTAAGESNPIAGQGRAVLCVDVGVDCDYLEILSTGYRFCFRDSAVAVGADFPLSGASFYELLNTLSSTGVHFKKHTFPPAGAFGYGHWTEYTFASVGAGTLTAAHTFLVAYRIPGQSTAVDTLGFDVVTRKLVPTV